jgi:hypothetical protein
VIRRSQASYHLVKLRFISVNDLGVLGQVSDRPHPGSPAFCSAHRADGRDGHSPSLGLQNPGLFPTKREMREQRDIVAGAIARIKRGGGKGAG